jgi:hypothetical protein
VLQESTGLRAVESKVCITSGHIREQPSYALPHAYMVWVSLLTSIVIVPCTRWLQQGRQVPIGRRTRNAGIAAGVMSYGSSWVVIWALTLAPFALVSALRETGVISAVAASLYAPSDLRGCQSIRCRTPTLKQLLHRNVPRRAMSGWGQKRASDRVGLRAKLSLLYAE